MKEKEKNYVTENNNPRGIMELLRAFTYLFIFHYRQISPLPTLTSEKRRVILMRGRVYYFIINVMKI